MLNMHNYDDDDTLSIIADKKITDISFGTTADYAFSLYTKKKQQIAELEYECSILIDKYHSAMSNAHSPPQFRQDIICDMFGDDKDISEVARDHFLTCCFSAEFLKNHRVEFEKPKWQGYEKTGVNVIFEVVGDDYYYSVEIPFPKNVVSSKKREILMGRVKFRADRIKKSKYQDFVKEWEPVQMPTYDWKKCFDAIETAVQKDEQRGIEPELSKPPA